MIDVNITEDRTEKLEIFKNDDLDSVIEVFCNKHDLEEEKKSFLKNLISQRLNENSS